MGERAMRTPEDLRELRKQGFRDIFHVFDQCSKRTMLELKAFQEDEEFKNSLSVREAAILKFYIKLMEEGDSKRMELLLNIYGIPTKIKAVQVTQVDETFKSEENKNKVVDVTPIAMNKEEKLRMLDKFRSIVESGSDDGKGNL